MLLSWMQWQVKDLSGVIFQVPITLRKWNFEKNRLQTSSYRNLFLKRVKWEKKIENRHIIS